MSAPRRFLQFPVPRGRARALARRARRLLLERGGFTMFELALYIVIFAIVATLAGNVLGVAMRSKRSIGRLSEVQINLERVLAQMIDRVHTSMGIADASSTLNLQMASSTLNPTIYALANNTITMQEGASAAASATPPTILITALTFTKITNPAPSTSSVQITVTGGYNDGGSVDPNTTYTLRTTALPL